MADMVDWYKVYGRMADLEPERHMSTAVKLWVDVDVGIVDFVLALNEIDTVRTLTSCQGVGNGDLGYVLILWKTEEARAEVEKIAIITTRTHWNGDVLPKTWAYVLPIPGRDYKKV